MNSDAVDSQSGIDPACDYPAAWATGGKAFRAGMSLAHNPFSHVRENEAWKAWDSGFRAAAGMPLRLDPPTTKPQAVSGHHGEFS